MKRSSVLSSCKSYGKTPIIERISLRVYAHYPVQRAKARALLPLAVCCKQHLRLGTTAAAALTDV